ncbi:MAG: NUDIX hydrolase [Phycisphaerae bacterium]|nr:NUDIX hydrolase [Phycisphaerae bacterium]
MQTIIHASMLVVDDSNRLLLVQEDGPHNHGKWNLPGGGVEVGEPLAASAEREVREETGLEVRAEGLIGVYTGFGEFRYINFVFLGRATGGQTTPQTGEILACRWFDPHEALDLDPHEVLNPRKLRRIIEDWQSQPAGPLSIIVEDMYG